jgi:hypothetical protein
MQEGNRIQAVSAIVSATATMSANANVISNFAWLHMMAATLFERHAAEVEHEHRLGHITGDAIELLRAYVRACLSSCASALEALINELFIASLCCARSSRSS